MDSFINRQEYWKCDPILNIVQIHMVNEQVIADLRGDWLVTGGATLRLMGRLTSFAGGAAEGISAFNVALV